jgi:hypothetical protein
MISLTVLLLLLLLLDRRLLPAGFMQGGTIYAAHKAAHDKEQQPCTKAAQEQLDRLYTHVSVQGGRGLSAELFEMSQA